MVRVVGGWSGDEFVIVAGLAALDGSVASSLEGSLDISTPVVSRFLLPINDLYSVWLRHRVPARIRRWVAFPSPNGKSWNPHTAGKLTL